MKPIRFTVVYICAVCLWPNASLSAATTAPGKDEQPGHFCGDSVTSGPAESDSEQKSMDSAIAWWKSRAGTNGKVYETWDLAQDKSVVCEVLDNGKTRCIAIGGPCLPSGSIPDRGPRVDM